MQRDRRRARRSDGGLRRAGERGVRESRPAPRRGPLSRCAGVSRPRRRARDGRLGAREQAGHARLLRRSSQRLAAPFPDIKKPAAGQPSARAAEVGRPIVQWDTPIPPPEAYGILAKMSSFKEATVYKVGRELSRQRRLGDGSDAADRGVALVAGQADDDEADHRLFGAAARERSVVDEPRAEDGRAAAHRSGRTATS